MRPAAGLVLLAAVAAGCGRGGARAQVPDSASAMDGRDREATAAAEMTMAMPAAEDLHMTLTPATPPAPGDSERAAALVAQIRRDLAKYRDVRVAEADGFRQFLPGVKNQPVYHYTNRLWALEEIARFDASKPTSLLYRRKPDGTLQLIGVMYADRAATSLDELNARVPLSIARWHQHVNWCVPARGEYARWHETKHGQPVFGPRSPIATEAACDSVGGRFLPRIFGWMVHVNAFESDDPAVIWGGEHHDMDMHH